MQQQQERTHEFNALKLSTYTSLAYFAADLVIYPIDSLATRLKVNVNEHLSMFQEFKKVKNSPVGIKALYKGYQSTFYCSFAPTFIYFMIYENLSQSWSQYFQQNDNKNNQKLQHIMPFFISGIGELSSLFLYLPFDIVRTRLQIDNPQYQYKGIFDGMNQVYKNEGFLRLYKASHIYITVTTLQTSLQFQFYEAMRKYYLYRHSQQQQTQLQSLPLISSLCVSVASTAIATFIVNPLDLIMTRFQCVDTRVEKASAKKIVKDLLKKEGPSGFFKGLGARMVYCCTYSLFWLPIYDKVKGKYGVQLEF